jgi:hypothetical protein
MSKVHVLKVAWDDGDTEHIQVEETKEGTFLVHGFDSYPSLDKVLQNIVKIGGTVMDIKHPFTW